MSFRRLAVALACIALVLNAGCAGLTGTGPADGTDTTTPAATETTTATTTASTTEAVEQLAPGLTSSGVTDALALANAHRTELQTKGFVKRATFVRENATHRGVRRATVRVANESHWLATVSGRGLVIAAGMTNGTYAEYADGEMVVYRISRGGNASYGVRALAVNDDRVPVPPEELFRSAVYDRALVYTLFGNADVTVVSSNASAVRVRGTAEELTINRREPRTSSSPRSSRPTASCGPSTSRTNSRTRPSKRR